MRNCILKNVFKNFISASEKITEREKKGRSLDKLRESREKRAKANRTRHIEKKERKLKGYSSETENSMAEDDFESPAMTFEEGLSIQVKRDDLADWIHKPMFDKAITGCLAKVSLGGSSNIKETVYRCVLIENIHEYHRKYKVNSRLTNLALNLSHGNSQKVHLMDMISNQPITLVY